jgi:hypothetical protein
VVEERPAVATFARRPQQLAVVLERERAAHSASTLSISSRARSISSFSRRT